MSTIELICKQCGQKLRIPAGLGDLSLTCPKCRHTWDESQPKKPANALATSLFFEDNDSFYTLLSAMEKSGEHFTIETPFTNYRELPDRLKRMIEVDAITGRLRFEFRPTSEPPSERT